MKKLLSFSVIMVATMAIVGCSNQKEDTSALSSTSEVDSSSTVAESTSISTVESTESETIESTESIQVEETTTTVFTANDVSDTTIQSIQTYEDYLTMYQAIITNYLSDYENAINDTVLYDASVIKGQKTQYDKEFEEQKKQYSGYGKSKLVGKDTLVDFLISYRDNLKSVTDSLADSF